jgi:hypothetical protein
MSPLAARRPSRTRLSIRPEITWNPSGAGGKSVPMASAALAIAIATFIQGSPTMERIASSIRESLMDSWSSQTPELRNGGCPHPPGGAMSPRRVGERCSPARTRTSGATCQRRLKKGTFRCPSNHSAFCSGFEIAMVSPASPTLNRAKRRTEMFSPSLPIFVVMSCEIEMVWSLMKGCSYRQTSS